MISHSVPTEHGLTRNWLEGLVPVVRGDVFRCSDAQGGGAGGGGTFRQAGEPEPDPMNNKTYCFEVTHADQNEANCIVSRFNTLLSDVADVLTDDSVTVFSSHSEPLQDKPNLPHRLSLTIKYRSLPDEFISKVTAIVDSWLASLKEVGFTAEMTIQDSSVS